MFKRKAFTIVELLVVIVIIGILATVVLVSYSGVTQRANDVSLAIDLKNAATRLKAYQSQYGSYPASLDALGCPVASGNLPADANYCIKTTASNSVYNYTGSGQTFSLILKSPSNLYYQSTESVAQTTFTPAPFMQTITNANCPSTRTRAQDARDTKTYWVQKISGSTSKCWMLTNLAYAGGGTNTYGDVKTLSLGTVPVSDLTTPKYYINPNVTSFTTEPNNPSSNTDGNGQWGFFYNFCAAMGAQLSTAACANATTPVYDPAISICPSGWRAANSYDTGFAGFYANGNSYPTSFNAFDIYLNTYLVTKTGYPLNEGANWPISPPSNAMFSMSSTFNGGQMLANNTSTWVVSSSGESAFQGNSKGTASVLRCVAN